MFLIDESFLDRTVDLAVGQVIELRLKENPTTGFRWSFAADGKPCCTVVSDAFERKQGPPGAGGEHAWQMKAVRVGNCELQLFYRRSFDPHVPPARSFTLHLKVTE